jgi:uncharacterized protein (TIGR03083 family)
MITTDGERLLTILTDHDPTAPVPSCPAWTLQGLLAHTAGAWRWGTQSLRASEVHQDRVLAEAPASVDELIPWAHEALAEVVALLAELPPDRPVWTPVGRTANTTWWARKMAVESAVHRWDAEAAVSASPGLIEAETALAGIDEHLTEFLPYMLHRARADAPTGTVLLRPDDLDSPRLLDLDRTKRGVLVTEILGEPDTTVTGTASDILLWMWNRSAHAHVSSQDLAVRWKILAI